MFETVNLLVLFAAAAAGMWAVAVGVPMYARSVFSERVSALHDEVADAVIARELSADAAAVRDFLAVTRAMSLQPAIFGLSEALAVHLAHDEFGHDAGCDPASYSDLAPSARKLMHEADQRLTAELRRYLVFGSRFWAAFVIFFVVRRAVFRLKVVTSTPRPKGAGVVVLSTEDLAEDIREDAKRRVHELDLGPVPLHV